MSTPPTAAEGGRATDRLATWGDGEADDRTVLEDVLDGLNDAGADRWPANDYY